MTGEQQGQSRARAARRTHLLRAIFALCAVALWLALAPAAGATAPSFTWNGAASTEEWSLAKNWEGKTAPTENESVSELRFPELTSSTCMEVAPVDACYFSEDNVVGLSAKSLHVDDGHHYEIEGDKLALGSNGLLAKPTGTTNGPATDVIDLPLELSASQAWNVFGSGAGASDEEGILLEEPVTGAGNALTVELHTQAVLALENNIEVGDLTLQGGNPSKTGIENGVVDFEEGALNSGNNKQVALGNILFRGSGTTGPLTTDGTLLDIGHEAEPLGGIEVFEAAFDPASTLTFRITGATPEPEKDYSQLTSEAGHIALGGVNVAIEVARPAKNKPCPTLTRGETFTFIETGGSVTGEFAGVPGPHDEIPLKFEGCTPLKQGIKLVYGPHTVTGIVEGEVVEREAREAKERQEAKEHQEAKEAQERQEAKEAKEHQEAKEARESKERQEAAKALAEALAARSGQGSGVGKIGVLSFKEGFPFAGIAGTSVTVSASGSFVLKITCPGGETSCTGTVTMRTLHAVVATPKHRAAVLSLASGSFTVPGGQSKTLTLHLSATARKLLARTHVLSAKATITAHDPSGATHTGVVTVTLHAAKAKHA